MAHVSDRPHVWSSREACRASRYGWGLGGGLTIEPARTGGGENPPDKMISSQSRTRRGVARCACGVPLEHLFFTYHKLIRHKRIFNARVGAGRPAWAPGDRSFARFRPFGPTRARLKPQGSPAATRSNAFRPIEKIFALSQLRLPGPYSFSQGDAVERGPRSDRTGARCGLQLYDPSRPTLPGLHSEWSVPFTRGDRRVFPANVPRKATPRPDTQSRTSHQSTTTV